MKNLCLTIIFALITLSASAQQYTPFPKSGAIWRETKGENDAGEQSIRTWEYHIQQEKDTLMAGKIYQLLTYKQWYYYWPNQKAYSAGRYGAIREDSAKHIYFYSFSSEKEFLLYDFNLKIGDSLPKTYNNYGGNRVVTIDSVLVGNKYHKRFGIQDNSSGAEKPFVYLIEGLGSTLGLIALLRPPFENHNILNCFLINGKSVFPENAQNCDLVTSVKKGEIEIEYFKIFPNPTTVSFTIQTQSIFGESDICVRDVLGRIIFREELQFPNQTISISSQPKGLYLVELRSGNKSAIKKLILE